MLLLGAGIDWLAGTKPWWMLSLGLLGLVVGMYRFIRDAMRMNTTSSTRGGPKNPNNDRPNGGPAAPGSSD